jgi:hypothetical protein
MPGTGKPSRCVQCGEALGAPVQPYVERIYERAVLLAEEGEVDFETFGEPAAAALRLLRPTRPE